MNSVTDYPVKQITQVRAEEPYTLYVTKHDGKEIELDLTPLIKILHRF
jgi:hypothetical protein